MMNKKKINIPIYNVEVEVIVAETVKEGFEQTSLQKAYNSEQMLAFDGLFADTEDGELYLIFQRGCSSSIVAHECIHLTQHIFKMIGAKLDDGSEECFAYLHTYIMNEVNSVLEEDSASSGTKVDSDTEMDSEFYVGQELNVRLPDIPICHVAVIRKFAFGKRGFILEVEDTYTEVFEIVGIREARCISGPWILKLEEDGKIQH